MEPHSDDSDKYDYTYAESALGWGGSDRHRWTGRLTLALEDRVISGECRM